MSRKIQYRVSGDRHSRQFAVIEQGGGTLYDLIDSRSEAMVICYLLNAGKGPEWDKIQDEVEAAMGVGATV